MNRASEYLERIGYNQPATVWPDALRDLHLTHMYAVPFENLDIHAGRPIVLEEAPLFDKIVVRRRGGFCYELNGLFAALLRELGFNVELLSAEVACDGGFSPPFDHLALRVDSAGPWLVDVGFGDGFLLPLRLNDSGEQSDGSSVYRLETAGPYRVLWRRDGDQPWRPQYRFTLEPHRLQEFAARCRFHQTSPDSHFTRNRICTLATPQGRVTLSGMRLIVTTHGAKSERLLDSPEQVAAALRRHFGVLE